MIDELRTVLGGKCVVVDEELVLGEVCWMVVGSTLMVAVLMDCFVVHGSDRLLGELCQGIVFW